MGCSCRDICRLLNSMCETLITFRAQEHFKESLEIYCSVLGPSNNLVIDLESRIVEVQTYVDE